MIQNGKNGNKKKEEKEGVRGADERQREDENVQRITERDVAEVDQTGGQKEQEVLEG